VKRSASINQLKTSDIRDYVKFKLKRKQALALEELENKLTCYKGEHLEKLDSNVLDRAEIKLQHTLSTIEARLNKAKQKQNGVHPDRLSSVNLET